MFGLQPEDQDRMRTELGGLLGGLDPARRFLLSRVQESRQPKEEGNEATRQRGNEGPSSIVNRQSSMEDATAELRERFTEALLAQIAGLPGQFLQQREAGSGRRFQAELAGAGHRAELGGREKMAGIEHQNRLAEMKTQAGLREDPLAGHHRQTMYNTAANRGDMGAIEELLGRTLGEAERGTIERQAGEHAVGIEQQITEEMLRQVEALPSGADMLAFSNELARQHERLRQAYGQGPQAEAAVERLKQKVAMAVEQKKQAVDPLSPEGQLWRPKETPYVEPTAEDPEHAAYRERNRELPEWMGLLLGMQGKSVHELARRKGGASGGW